ncbi:hypothetical protein HanOQP8_Chr02g0048201 [Helianthus annuus]|nr:hypothetical protein HanOQP8_Chr02g0048201 [Helianthus annuus]
MRASKRNRNCDDQWWFSTMILDSSTAVILKRITRSTKVLECISMFMVSAGADIRINCKYDAVHKNHRADIVLG